MDKVLATPRLGELRIQKKLILNKTHPNNIEVAIGEVELVNGELHYIVSSGGGVYLRIIGKDNWQAFIDMIQWLDWDPDITQETETHISQHNDPSNTIPRIQSSPKTLELDIPDIDDEISNRIPIDD